jgi:hypothetical protein
VTGAEHYRQAERLLAAVNRRIGGDDRNEYVQIPSRRAELRAEAQVHATLAHAAAVFLASNGGFPLPDHDQWLALASGYQRAGAGQ